MDAPTPSASRFLMPHDGRTYIEEVVERSRNLIQCGIWAGLQLPKLRSWLNNFCSDEERYFSACLLDNMIYRSEQQTVSLIWQLLQRTLVDQTRADPTPIGALTDWLGILRNSAGQNPNIRLVAVVRRDDPPTKSAYVIARLMKRYLRIKEDWIITPWAVAESISTGIQVIVYIDDFLGTGDQFSEMAVLEKLIPTFDSAYSIYAPLVAHHRGIANLRSLYPQLKLAPVELLGEEHSIFAPASIAFDDGLNTPEAAERLYLSILASRRITLYGSDRRGYGGLELAYAFSHAVPDNCLPILWYSHSPHWQPLFDR